MKKILIAILGILLLFSACGTGSPAATSLKVAVEESAWVEVENNGLSVLPGEDVTFRIRLAEDFSLTDTDYRGDILLSQEEGTVLLTLKNVRYPTRVKLTLSSENFVLHYDPNGGRGEAFTEIQEKKKHLRPNTANALVPFSKEGCTLLCWNTQPDGSGKAVGLGSRVTLGDAPVTLYAQWVNWTEERFFSWQEQDGAATITDCSFDGKTLVIPGELGGLPVTRLAPGAFSNTKAETVVFPDKLETAEPGCFRDTGVRELYLFDNIQVLSDDCFPEGTLETLHINAATAPAGAAKYKESCYADKLDLLILSQDQNRLVFYGGCSMWYNLDIPAVLRTLNDRLYPVNLALNGAVNSELQLRIMLPYLHEGDVFFHTPEPSSDSQMLRTTDMGSNEAKLWSGIEYNYDLLTCADLRGIEGVLDSLVKYLNGKQEKTSYSDIYRDSRGRVYCGSFGELPFPRFEPEAGELGDTVTLNRELITEESTQRLGQWYSRLQDKGISVFVSFACLNLDALPEEERNNVHEVNDAIREAVETMPGVVLLSDLMHFVYHNGHFFDTNYHLLSEYASTCTNTWMKNLKPYLR